MSGRKISNVLIYAASSWLASVGIGYLILTVWLGESLNPGFFIGTGAYTFYMVVRDLSAEGRS
jgi:hypothetical protein